MSALSKLDTAVRAVCPIDGVSLNEKNNKATWRIDFAVGATQAQRNAAADVVIAFDVAAIEVAEAAEVAIHNALVADTFSHPVAVQLRNIVPEQVKKFVDATFILMTAEQKAVITLLLQQTLLNTRIL